MGFYEETPVFGASHKWTLKELQVLLPLCWLHFCVALGESTLTDISVIV